jgi:hypothetical protein
VSIREVPMHSATENGPGECDGFHNQGHISSLGGVVITTLNRCCLKPAGDSCNYASGAFLEIIFCHALVMSLKRIARAWRHQKPELRHVSYMPTDSNVPTFSAYVSFKHGDTSESSTTSVYALGALQWYHALCSLRSTLLCRNGP